MHENVSFENDTFLMLVFCTTQTMFYREVKLANQQRFNHSRHWMHKTYGGREEVVDLWLQAQGR